MDYETHFELQSQEVIQDAVGTVSSTWKTTYAGFGHLRCLGSTEYWQAAAQQREDEMKLFCRWDKRLDVDTRSVRLLIHGEPYDIKYVENVETRNETCVIRVVKRSG